MHSQKNYIHGWWFLRLILNWIILFPRFQKFSYAFLICGAFEKLTFCTYKQKLLTNLRHFQKYRQYIGADCTRSVSLGSCFFRRLWPLVEMQKRMHIHLWKGWKPHQNWPFSGFASRDEQFRKTWWAAVLLIFTRFHFSNEQFEPLFFAKYACHTHFF